MSSTAIKTTLFIYWILKCSTTGRDGKPDYKRFLPNNSFINIYDYKTVDELAKHINKIASERAEYAKYMPFKSGHQLTRKQLYGLGLKELIAKSKEIISPDESFFSELVAKEKSDNKLCKVASYLRRTPEDDVARQIAARQSERDPPEVACLKVKNLQRDFEIKWTLWWAFVVLHRFIRPVVLVCLRWQIKPVQNLRFYGFWFDRWSTSWV